MPHNTTILSLDVSHLVTFLFEKDDTFLLKKGIYPDLDVQGRETYLTCCPLPIP